MKVVRSSPEVVSKFVEATSRTQNQERWTPADVLCGETEEEEVDKEREVESTVWRGGGYAKNIHMYKCIVTGESAKLYGFWTRRKEQSMTLVGATYSHIHRFMYGKLGTVYLYRR